MLHFGAGLAATSNPFCVNSEGFLARNGEMPGDMDDSRGAANGYVELFLTPERFAHDLRRQSFR
jgi:hypothetical protein